MFMQKTVDSTKRDVPRAKELNQLHYFHYLLLLKVLFEFLCRVGQKLKMTEWQPTRLQALAAIQKEAGQQLKTEL